MSSPSEIKRQLRKTIVEAVRRDGKAVRSVLVSSLKLEPGFTEKTIIELLQDMVNVGYIEVAGDTITLGSAVGKEEEKQ